jgi:hypothetical protein
MSHPILKRGSAVIAIVGALLLAVSCQSADEESLGGGCRENHDCPLDTVCERETSTCIAELSGAMMGAFQCTVYAEHLDMADVKDEKFGGAEILGVLPDGERLTLTARVYCYHDGTSFIVVAEDAAEADHTGLTDSFILDAEADFAAISGAAPGSPVPLRSAEVVRFVQAEGERRDYARSTTGKLFVDKVPVPGATITGHVDVRGLALCKWATGEECFDSRFDSLPTGAGGAAP